MLSAMQQMFSIFMGETAVKEDPIENGEATQQSGGQQQLIAEPISLQKHQQQMQGNEPAQPPQLWGSEGAIFTTSVHFYQ